MLDTDIESSDESSDEIDGVHIHSMSSISATKQLLIACRVGAGATVDTILRRLPKHKIPPEALLEAIAWSRLDVVRMLLRAGASVTARGSVHTPGGTGITHKDTQDTSAVELSQLMVAGRVRHAGMIASLVSETRNSTRDRTTSISEAQADTQADAGRRSSRILKRQGPPTWPARQVRRRCVSNPDERASTEEAIGEGRATWAGRRRASSAQATGSSQDHEREGQPCSRVASRGATTDVNVPTGTEGAAEVNAESATVGLPDAASALRITNLEAEIVDLRASLVEQGRMLRTLYLATAASARVMANGDMGDE